MGIIAYLTVDVAWRTNGSITWEGPWPTLGALAAAHGLTWGGACAHRVDAMTCPHCGEAVMVEYDPSIRRWFCECCGRLSVALKPKRKENDG